MSVYFVRETEGSQFVDGFDLPEDEVLAILNCDSIWKKQIVGAVIQNAVFKTSPHSIFDVVKDEIESLDAWLNDPSYDDILTEDEREFYLERMEQCKKFLERFEGK